MDYRFGKEPSRTINCACAAERDDREELLAKTSEGMEFGMVDFGICTDLGMVGDIAMRELAAYDIWVLRKSGKC
jgi:hypothetical protein